MVATKGSTNFTDIFCWVRAKGSVKKVSGGGWNRGGSAYGPAEGGQAVPPANARACLIPD